MFKANTPEPDRFAAQVKARPHQCHVIALHADPMLGRPAAWTRIGIAPAAFWVFDGNK